MLGPVLDVFRLRQYFDVVVRTRDLIEGIRDDARFLDDARRALVPLPFDAWPDPVSPFPSADPPDRPTRAPRIAILATGGSGALASVVGVARALEEHGRRPSLISLCSGSALFGFPIAAGLSADEAAAFCLGLRPRDYVDVDWRRLLLLAPTRARGFAGIVRGEYLEATYRALLGDMTLGELPIPAYAPIWNVEENRVEYLGPRTHPHVTVARAVRMAVSLPLFIQPVELGHPDVAQDQVERLLPEPVQGDDSVGGRLDVVSVGGQHLGEHARHFHLVIHDQDPFPTDAGRALGRHGRPCRCQGGLHG